MNTFLTIIVVIAMIYAGYKCIKAFIKNFTDED
jgi:hypothetical protein